MQCPICHKDDRVFPVESMTRQTVQNVYRDTDGYTTARTERTQLAQMLDAPLEPRKPPVSGGVFISGVAMAIISSYSCFFGVVLAYSATLQESNLGAAFLVIPGCILAILGVTPALLWLWYVIFSKKRKRLLIERKERYEEEMSQWRALVEKWSRLYYCERCDIVFDSDSGYYCHPMDMQKLLETL